MKVNINTQVTVRLTPFGKARWKGLFFSEAEDVITIPVWELMQVFGLGIHMSMPEMYFVDNELDIL